MTRAPQALRAVAAAAARAVAAAGVPRPGDGVAVAVSGGADSLAALHALRTLAGPRRWRLTVLSVDHGQRPGSAADAAFVAEHASSLGLPAQVLTLAPGDVARHRTQGTEGALRAARYTALHRAAAAAGLDWIATGHTRDDQAETVLLQLLRGAGPDGLAGMPVVGGPAGRTVVRPLLTVTRAQTRDCCAAIGVAWRDDPTNADQDLLRNAVRGRVLPLLEELRPGAGAALARTAELARAERDWAETVAAATLATLTTGVSGDDVGADLGTDLGSDLGTDVGSDLGSDVTGGTVAVLAAALAALPLGLARRVVRAAAARAGQPPPTAAAADAVLTLAAPGGRDGATADWQGGSAGRAGDLVVWPATPARAQLGADGATGMPVGSARPAGDAQGAASVFEDDIESVLLTEKQVQEKVRDLAAQVSKDYAGREPLLVGVLKGAFFLMADLARALAIPHEFDFMAVSSYGSATETSGVVRILKDLDREIQGRDVLIVEDIIDSGLTLSYLLKNLRSRRPATIEVCALLSKPDQLKADIEVKYRGFDIPNVFVVGYGLDYDERYRNLPFVATLKPEVYQSV